MATIAEFVDEHTQRTACICGRCIDSDIGPKTLTGHTVNMHFFDVSATGNPSVELFRSLSKPDSEFANTDPFDGKEHNYIEIGGWIGDQGLAMQYMALGALLGCWRILTPESLLGKGDETKELRSRMAGMGFVSIVPPKESADAK